MLRLKKQDIFSGHWKAVWKKRLFFFLIKICLKGHFILVITPLDYSCCKPALLHQLTDSPNRIGTIGFN